jgi:tripartite-type tricarboxylate transporter receptor subunit TctC
MGRMDHHSTFGRGACRIVMRGATIGALVGFAAAVPTIPASAADFFAGKSIDLLIGAPPAGGYDIYARALARSYGRNIPGKPNIVAKNMPGAASGRAAGYLANLAPKDGTVLAAIMPGAVMAPLLDDKPEILFDPVKVNYLGTANNGTRVCISRKGSVIQTFDDVLTKKAIFGGVSNNDSTRDYGYMHKHTSGAIYSVIAGYNGTNDLGLALERAEIDGACGWDWASFKAQKGDWLRDNKVNVLLQVGLEPNEELTRMGVPSVWNYVKDEDSRKVVELVIGQQVFQRSYIAPPGTPPEQLRALRTAFDVTMHDPQFLADADTMHIDISPLPGDKVQEIVQKLYSTPKDIIEKARAAIRP